MAKNANSVDKGAGGADKVSLPVSAQEPANSGSINSAASTPGLEASSKLDGLGQDGQTSTEQAGSASLQSGGTEQLGTVIATATKTEAIVGERTVVRPPDIRISVTAKTNGFRRAGIVFGNEPTILAIKDLSDKQIELLREESATGKELTIVQAGDAEDAPDMEGQ